MGNSGSGIKSLEKANPNNTWQPINVLGSGSYGKVHMVRQRHTGEIAAAKVAKLKQKEEIYNFEAELDILATRRHVNITNYINGYINGDELWIVIELCEAGALADIMKNLGGPLDEPCIRVVCKQALAGLAFLHANKTIHRDINASNMLVSATGVVKIADFGVSAILKSETQKRSTFIGSPFWMAPEVIACEKSAQKPYTSRADIWSLAITLIELAQTRPPNSDLHPVKAMLKTVSQPPPTLADPSSFSQDFSDFLASALIKDMNARPDAETLSQHSFCAGAPPKRVLVELVDKAKQKKEEATTASS
eukprot:m.18770 g.18770  ORF g.18770 m.18770 type:complete len:307 (+) comp7944_c0_seq2:128-1048(+)